MHDPTGLHGAEKRFYKWFITAVLGARCHNDFSRKKTEFLIAKPTAVESEKMQMARKHGVPVQPLEWLEAKVEEECTHTQVSSVRIFVACVPSHDPTRTLFISVSCVSARGVLSF